MRCFLIFMFTFNCNSAGVPNIQSNSLCLSYSPLLKVKSLVTELPFVSSELKET